MNRTENGETIHATVTRCFWRPLNLLNEFLMAIFGFSFQRINQLVYLLKRKGSQPDFDA